MSLWSGKPGRISAILIVSLLVLTTSWVILSQWFVPGLIARAYYGRTWPAVTHLITGQASHSVEEYLATWNRFAWTATVVVMFGGLLLVLVVRPEFQDFFWGPDPPHREHVGRPPSLNPPPARSIDEGFFAHSTSNLGLVFLSGMLLFASVLRLVFLGSKSFFEDEVFSVFLARQHLPTFFRILLDGEANMGLYYFILHFWIYLGRSEFIVRSLSVLFAVATLPVLFVIGKHLFDQEIGALAAFLLAINGFHTAYSQLARSYSLLVFLASLSSWYFIRSVEEPSRKNWARYIVTTTLTVYCHLFAALLPLSHWAALAFLRHRKAPWRRMFAASAAIGFFLLPLVAFILRTNRRQLDWVLPFHPHVVLTMFSEFATDSRILSFDPGRILLLCILLIPAAVASIVRTSPAKLTTEVWHLRFLFAWLIVPITIAASISLYKPIFRPNYLIFCLPPFLLLASFSLCRMPWSWLTALTLAFITITTGRGLAAYYRSPGSQDWKATTGYVLANTRPNDVFVFYPPHLLHAFEYYRERLGYSVTQPDLLESPPAEEFQRFVAGLSSHNERVWLIGRNEATEQRSLERRSLEACLVAEFPFRTDKQFHGTIAILFSKQDSVLARAADPMGNVWRRPKGIDSWSVSSVQQRLVNTGGRLIKRARCFRRLLADSHLTRRLFGTMLRRIGALPVPTG